MSGLDQAYEIAAQLVAERDRDRFLACQFVPASHRRHILALLAFSAEIAGIRDHVSGPMPGEIRLQWWRDALDGRAEGTAANPLARALLDTCTKFSLPIKSLQDLIDARVFDLYDDAMPTLNDLEGYLGETCSCLFQLSAIILNDGQDPDTADLSGHAGVAFGLTGLMQALGKTAARGQCFLPLDRLSALNATRDMVVGLNATPGVLAVLDGLRERAGGHLSVALKLLKSSPDRIRPAYLPLLLVGPGLDRLARRSHRPFDPDLGLPAWRKPLALWWGARRL